MTPLGPNRRPKGTGSIIRVPHDRTKPVRYWRASLEQPSEDGRRHRWTAQRKTEAEAVDVLEEKLSELSNDDEQGKNR